MWRRCCAEHWEVAKAECIYTAGEKEYEIMLKREKTGVPINAALQKNMIDLKRDYNLTQYHFDFE